MANLGRTALAALLLVAASAGTSIALAQAGLTEAEVRKVDRDNRKITLKHAEIKDLDMPPMTMVFNVSDPKLLENLKAGDKVRFRAVNESGKMIVTEIQPSR